MINFKDNSRIVPVCLLTLVLISFVYSFITGEDSLGGAENDYKLNNIFLLSFSENFNLAIRSYGISADVIKISPTNDHLKVTQLAAATYDEVRNLPTFNIILSQLINLGFKISHFKYLNLLILIFIIFYFLKSLKVEYVNLSFNSKILFSSIIILSPTIRSLINYPYPFLWGICFFIISIYFYLNFKNYENDKFQNAFYCILNLSLASYMTPNFSVFIIIFLSKFFNEYKFSKKFFQICFFSIILSLPALSFLIWKDFYIFRNEVFELPYSEKFNFSNKIIIITSFIFLFFIPYLTEYRFKKVSLNSIISIRKIYIILFFLLCVFFFNFKVGAGGGIFYQFSNLIFGNNILLFLIFIFSLFIFDIYKIYNFENFLIFITLILYNLQYTIYYKYFDPLLLFIFLFIVNIKRNNNFDINILGKKYFIFYVLFLLLNIFKNDLKFLLV